MNIIPYIIDDGIPTIKDIMGLFDTMEAEDLIRWVFYDGSVQDRVTFLNVMKANNLCVVVEEEKPIAFVWFTDRRVRQAQIHFCFFKEARGKKAREVGKFILDVMMGADFDCLVGYIPKFNYPAINLFKDLGVEFSGVIRNGIYNHRNNRSEDCYVVYFDMVPTYP